MYITKGLKEITLDFLAEDFQKGSVELNGSKHLITVQYKDYFESFYEFCEYVKRSGYIII